MQTAEQLSKNEVYADHNSELHGKVCTQAAENENSGNSHAVWDCNCELPDLHRRGLAIGHRTRHDDTHMS